MSRQNRNLCFLVDFESIGVLLEYFYQFRLSKAGPQTVIYYQYRNQFFGAYSYIVRFRHFITLIWHYRRHQFFVVRNNRTSTDTCLRPFDRKITCHLESSLDLFVENTGSRGEEIGFPYP